LAEIEHFVDPDDKSHPKYAEVADLEFFMFPRDEQMSGQSAKKIRLGEAVSKVSFNNSVVVNALFTPIIVVYSLLNDML
jgi:glycyl-tRNA synthetase